MVVPHQSAAVGEVPKDRNAVDQFVQWAIARLEIDMRIPRQHEPFGVGRQDIGTGDQRVEIDEMGNVSWLLPDDMIERDRIELTEVDPCAGLQTTGLCRESATADPAAGMCASNRSAEPPGSPSCAR